MSAHLDVAPACCDTEGCSRMATHTIEDHGRIVGRYCDDCIAIIELILEETRRISRTGVPQEIAAEWAARAVKEIA